MATRHPGQFDLEFHAPALLDAEITGAGLFDQELEARAIATAVYVPYDLPHSRQQQPFMAT
jgi:hypothetical protein